MLIEKCRPIDKKLKYQLDKLLAAAANPAGNTGAMAHRPRPQQMIGEADDESDGEDSGEAAVSERLYTVPKIGAAMYDASGADAKAEKKAAAKRGRALKSDLIKSMQVSPSASNCLL